MDLLIRLGIACVIVTLLLEASLVMVLTKTWTKNRAAGIGVVISTVCWFATFFPDFDGPSLVALLVAVVVSGLALRHSAPRVIKAYETGAEKRRSKKQ